MRQPEIDYWNKVAEKTIIKEDDSGNIRLCMNMFKYQHILKRLYGEPLMGKSILEIGCGPCIVFGTIANCMKFSYVGTELSNIYVDMVKKYWKFNVYQTDITELPVEDNSCDYVVALDTLEHVLPADRLEGYQEIDRVLKKEDAKIFINNPDDRAVTGHPAIFDHGFALEDLCHLLRKTNTKLKTLERYSVSNGYEDRYYEWIVCYR